MERPSFNELYKVYLSTITENMSEIKDAKKKSLSQFLSNFIRPFLIFLLLVISPSLYRVLSDFHKSSIEEIRLRLFILIIAFIICLFFSLLIAKKLYRTDLYKDIVMPDLLRLYDNLHWESIINSHKGSLIKFNTLIMSKLFMNFNDLSFDDIFFGKYKDINFEIAEIKTGVNTYKNYIDGFRGVVLAFDNLTLPISHTVFGTRLGMFAQNSFTYAYESFLLYFGSFLIFGIISLFIDDFVFIGVLFICIFFLILFIVLILILCSKYTRPDSLYFFKKLKIGNKYYDKHFMFYSSDEADENKNVLTADILKCICKLEKVFSTKNIKCAFYDNKFLISVYTTKNLFELGKMGHSVQDIKNLKSFYEQINAVYDIIEALSQIENNQYHTEN